MADNLRFQVRDTEEELEKLDNAILLLGFKDRADWYRDVKRKAIAAANRKGKQLAKLYKEDVR